MWGSPGLEKEPCSPPPPCPQRRRSSSWLSTLRLARAQRAGGNNLAGEARSASALQEWERRARSVGAGHGKSQAPLPEARGAREGGSKAWHWGAEMQSLTGCHGKRGEGKQNDLGKALAKVTLHSRDPDSFLHPTTKGWARVCLSLFGSGHPFFPLAALASCFACGLRSS